MPTYRVRCPKCKKDFDAVASIAERENIQCTCGSKVIRLIVPSSNGFDPFKPYLLENGVDEPTMITSRAERDRIFRENKIDQKEYKNRKYNPYTRIFPCSGSASKGSGTRWTGNGLSY